MHHDEKEEILDDFTLEVKKIEEDTEKILSEAAAKKDEMIANSKVEAGMLITKKQTELEAKKEDKLKKQKEKIDSEKAEIIKEGEKETVVVEKKARKNIEKAAELVLKKLDKAIGEL